MSKMTSPGPSPAPSLTAEGVGKRFGSFQALADVDLELRPGEIHCLLGENGAGKSTLCNLIFGLHPPDSGELTLGGAPYRPRGPADALAAGIAMVHQHFSLVPELSVLENLCLGAGWRRFDRGRERARLEATAERFGIVVPFDALVETLSVGQRQKVEILKCLARDPRIVVLDEPTAVLPPGEIDSLLDLIERMAAGGKAILLVTHKLAEITRVADRITVLRRGRVTLQSKGRQVIGINIGVLGLTTIAARSTFGRDAGFAITGFGKVVVPGLADLPVIGPMLFTQSGFVYAAPLVALLIAVLLYRTTAGLALRAAGNEPRAVDKSGASVIGVRWLAVLVTGLASGLGGAVYSLADIHTFTENMTSGAGYLALAAVIFGRWRVVGTIVACLVFGVASSLQFQLPALGIDFLPAALLIMMPYVLALLAVSGLVGRQSPPRALTIPFNR